MKLGELRTLLISAAQKHVSAEEANYFAEEVLETAVRKEGTDAKYQDHTIADIVSWNAKSGAIAKSIDLPGYTQYDFHGRGPSLKIKQIHDELERKAQANGIAMISVINSAGMHTMHLWTQGLAKRGLFALGAWNGGPDAVVPTNGTKGLLGTNPLTYGFPGDKGDIVVDMATSEIPYFKIVNAAKDGSALPLNTAVDSSGEVTTDPKLALTEAGVSNLLPMGGNYKGYNINYLMEVMTSALVGARASSQMSDAYIETEHGGFIIAIDINKTSNRTAYDESIESLNQEIRAQRPKAGVDAIKVPGDTNLEKKRKMNDDMEISLSEQNRELLIKLAE